MSSRALANQERALQAERLSQSLRALLLWAATLLSLGTVGLLAADQLYRPNAFVIDQLKIKGSFRHLEPQDVEAVVREHSVGNFFSVQLAYIEHQVEQLPWVQNAEVRREWPDTLLVELQEHRPVMRWGKDAWVNSYGEVVTLPLTTELSSSIVLNGHERDAREMLQQSLKWQQRLNEFGLSLSQLHLSDSHAYQLDVFESGMKKPFSIKLGRTDVEERLDRFLKLYETELNADDSRLLRVDARYPDGLAIKKETLAVSAKLGDKNE